MHWKQLLESLSESVNDHLRLRNDYLKAKNHILRRQIDGRVQLTDGERKELAESGTKLGKKALEEIATVASPETIFAWKRKFADHKDDTPAPRQTVGCLCVDKKIEDLVVRMARENRSWGYDRIQGAVKHLGYRISDQTVGNILKRHGIPPAPERTKTTTWKEFIRIHMARPRGHRLLRQCRVELVSTGDFCRLLLYPLQGSFEICHGHEGSALCAMDGADPLASRRGTMGPLGDKLRAGTAATVWHTCPVASPLHVRPLCSSRTPPPGHGECGSLARGRSPSDTGRAETQWLTVLRAVGLQQSRSGINGVLLSR